MSDYSKTTQDTILGGKVHLIQPKEGYRVAIDPILLAASIPAASGEKVLDVGSGVGAASLCLATRVNCSVVGMELQRKYLKIAMDNVHANHLDMRVEMIQGDLHSPPPRLSPSSFDHVMVNPPYNVITCSKLSLFKHKNISNAMASGDLKSWVDFACLMVKPKGSVSFIFPVARLHDLLSLLSDKLGALEIFPFWSSSNGVAKRFIIRGRKSIAGDTLLHRGMSLHTPGSNNFSPEAENILRLGYDLDFKALSQ